MISGKPDGEAAGKRTAKGEKKETESTIIRC